MRHLSRSAALVFAACVRAVEPAPAPAPEPTLEAHAVLAARTFAPGPPSGRLVDGGPFLSQPVQGFSSLLEDGDGGFLALSDNGYGTPESSADFRLRIYRLRVRGAALEVHGFIELKDPMNLVPFPIVNELTDAGRALTGADFDPESFQRDGDGGFFIGDELGPYLLHVNAEGRLVDPPFSHPDLFSPHHGRYEEAAVLKVMNALTAHALEHGARPPIVSPWHLLVADSDPLTAAPERLDAGLSSELFDVASLGRAGFEVIPWTVNAPGRAEQLRALGVAGIISDRPDLVTRSQGHRGARGLRPENTLAAFEAALELGVATLEADLLLTREGVPVIGHDPVLSVDKCRIAKPVAVRELTAAQVLKTVCDKRPAQFPEQKAPAGGSYTMPSLEQLFLRMKNEPVRFNLEIKHEPVALTDAVIALVRKHGLAERVDLQSFDLSALLRVHERAPELHTVALFGDNLEPDAGLLTGLEWPHGSTYLAAPPRVRLSSGFEALARAPDGTLWAMLEKPLDGGHAVRACAFDPRAKRWTGACFEYPLEPQAVAASDFQLTGPNDGVVLERDDTQGLATRFKRVFALTLSPLSKRELVDLTKLEVSMPFWTIESALPLAGGRLAVANDNNFPFAGGRSDAGAPDDDELFLVKLP